MPKQQVGVNSQRLAFLHQQIHARLLIELSLRVKRGGCIPAAQHVTDLGDTLRLELRSHAARVGTRKGTHAARVGTRKGTLVRYVRRHPRGRCLLRGFANFELRCLELWRGRGGPWYVFLEALRFVALGHLPYFGCTVTDVARSARCSSTRRGTYRGSSRSLGMLSLRERVVHCPCAHPYPAAHGNRFEGEHQEPFGDDPVCAHRCGAARGDTCSHGSAFGRRSASRAHCNARHRRLSDESLPGATAQSLRWRLATSHPQQVRDLVWSTLRVQESFRLNHDEDPAAIRLIRVVCPLN